MVGLSIPSARSMSMAYNKWYFVFNLGTKHGGCVNVIVVPHNFFCLIYLLAPHNFEFSF
jgi:hypothetical protein